MLKTSCCVMLLLTVFSIGHANAAWLETGGVVESRPGVRQSYVLSAAVNADKSSIDRNEVKNIVLLLTGGPGIIAPAVEGIKEQKPERVALRGFMAEKLGVVVAVGVPSDQQQGISTEWREGKSHVEDVSAVMDVILKQYPMAGVTVLGFSNGCRSAAHVSASVRQRWGGRLQGVAMLSCAKDAFYAPWMAALNRSGSGETALAKVPVLVVHHRRDSCLPFVDVEDQARHHDLIAIEDNKQPRPNITRRECGNGSAHQFGGKEETAYQSVVDWIRATQVKGAGLQKSLQ